MSCFIVGLSGCATISGDTYCDIAAPLYFENEDTVNFLIEKDEDLLKTILIHNETHQKVCE
jgi:hypothetical protein